jgi:hypothetical protein
MLILVLFIIILLNNIFDEKYENFEHMVDTNTCPCPESTIYDRIASAYSGKRVIFETVIDGKKYNLCMIPKSKCKNLTDSSDSVDCMKNTLVLVEKNDIIELRKKYDSKRKKEHTKCSFIRNIDCSNIENFKQEKNKKTSPKKSSPKPKTPTKNQPMKKEIPKSESVPIQIPRTVSAPISPAIPTNNTNTVNCEIDECSKYLEDNFVNTFVIEKGPRMQFRLFGSPNTLDTIDSSRMIANSFSNTKATFVCGDTDRGSINNLANVSLITSDKMIQSGIISSEIKNKVKVRMNTPKKDDNIEDTIYTYATICRGSYCDLGKNAYRVCLTDDINDALDFDVYMI